MEAKAVARFVRVSPFKARPVCDLVRGKSVIRAKEILAYTDRAVAEIIEKVVDSAAANAERTLQIRPESLVIKSIYADDGPTMKRIRPRAKGTASRINKRTCHITVVVGPREEA